MDYKELYTDALERARELSKTVTGANYEYIFPELKESEDQKMKKAIMHVLYENYTDAAVIEGVEIAEIIAWLEKQGKPTHVELGQSEVTKTSDQELEPKFKVGDCVISNDGAHTYLVKERKRGIYVILDYGEDKEFSIIIESADRTGRFWTIQDAKDGDVLVASDESIFIYAGSTDRYAKFYVALTIYGTFNFDGGNWEDKNSVHPSTKEQRDLLFHKMKEAGYEWDSKNKELKKIESKKLDPAKVIAWLVANIIDFEYYVKLFKQDFGL